MREIKFRAFFEADKRIYEVLCLDFASNEARLFDSDSGVDMDCRLDEIIFMQYTGLKDKNGKEIYEGDIVVDDEGDAGKVYYDQEEATFKVSFFDDCFTFWGIDDVEIIGNIYENAEPLKDKK